jgi:hypothetical protein
MPIKGKPPSPWKRATSSIRNKEEKSRRQQSTPCPALIVVPEIRCPGTELEVSQAPVGGALVGPSLRPHSSTWRRRSTTLLHLDFEDGGTWEIQTAEQRAQAARHRGGRPPAVLRTPTCCCAIPGNGTAPWALWSLVLASARRPSSMRRVPHRRETGGSPGRPTPPPCRRGMGRFRGKGIGKGPSVQRREGHGSVSVPFAFLRRPARRQARRRIVRPPPLPRYRTSPNDPVSPLTLLVQVPVRRCPSLLRVRWPCPRSTAWLSTPI